MKNLCSALHVAPDVTLYHTGPALDHGPLPSIFYFALSGPDTLTLDPFNQLIQFLHGEMIRVFSMTLPAHENNLPAKEAMNAWADDMHRHHNRINEFLDKAELALHFAIREQFIDPHHLATAGLSRGAFIAAHLAAREEKFKHIALFAPLTKLSYIKEFKEMNNPIANSLDLTHLAEKLENRHLKIFIGNDDTRVGTHECFDFAMQVVHKKKGRASHLEMHIYPSVGHMGHGTPPEIFKQGAQWLLSHLKIQ